MLRTSAPIVHREALSRFVRTYQTRSDNTLSRVAGCRVRTRTYHRKNWTHDLVHYYVAGFYCGPGDKGLSTAVKYARGRTICESYYAPHKYEHHARKLLDIARREGRLEFSLGVITAKGNAFIVSDRHCVNAIVAAEEICRLMDTLDATGAECENKNFSAAFTGDYAA